MIKLGMAEAEPRNVAGGVARKEMSVRVLRVGKGSR